MLFRDILGKYNWEDIKKDIYSKSGNEVEIALEKPKRDLEDLKALISPAAAPYIEDMAKRSNRLTQKRFGKTIQLYIPLYLSNFCNNHCLYCGFNRNNNIERIVLKEDQIIMEAEKIRSFGFEHILLVTGDSHGNAGIDYFNNVLNLILPYFSMISMEVQPLRVKEYMELIRSGLNTVYIYQETYNKKIYPFYHPKGTKADFNYRLETPDRLGNAGVHKIGLGFLIGLDDWRADAFFTALHLNYLEKKYWKTKYSISFPRLRPYEGFIEPKVVMPDRELVQLITAFRLFNEEVELSISTRESKIFRDNIIRLGITSMSAGSRTYPGGYSLGKDALKQFETDDNRTPFEIAEMIRSYGYEPVWKDWSAYMQLQIIKKPDIVDQGRRNLYDTY